MTSYPSDVASYVADVPPYVRDVAAFHCIGQAGVERSARLAVVRIYTSLSENGEARDRGMADALRLPLSHYGFFGKLVDIGWLHSMVIYFDGAFPC